MLGNTFITLTIFIICIAAIVAAGVYFALKASKTSRGTELADFSNINQLEGSFERLGRMRINRSVIYISVSLDRAIRLYREAKAWHIFSELKPIILKYFGGAEGEAAVYEKNNFVVLGAWQMKATEEKTAQCKEEINRCLLRFNALNVVDVRFGAYSAVASGISFDEAIGRAKQACTMAERENKSFAEWNSSGGRSFEKKIKIENNIEKQIDNNRFFLEYQPVVDAKTKKIIGAEVFSRLYSEQDGVVPPDSFLFAVDSVGVNEKFDYYIFEKNCKWISNNKSQREAYEYAINCSRTTLCDPMFSKKIIETVDRYNLKYSSVAIEILEDKEIDAQAKRQMAKNLSELREKGITILLDDFGSGYTSFDDLQNLAVDVIKIDRSITEKTNTQTGLAIFRNIVRTAKELGVKIVCEGIETEEQARIASEAGCDMLQGFYFYRPLAVRQLEELIQNDDKAVV